MLNCINGFYNPRDGQITFKGKTRQKMKTHEAAKQGIARTFQNIALFDGMATVDNIMTGRNLKMRQNFLKNIFCLSIKQTQKLSHHETLDR